LRRMYCGFIFLLGVGLLQGGPRIITTQTTQVGPGVVHKQMVEPHEPWTLNVLEVDLTNPWIAIESIKAGDRLGGANPVRVMAQNHSANGYKPVGAINGDYYSGETGYPINSQVVFGEVVKLETVDPEDPIYWPTISFDAHKRPAISVNAYTGVIVTSSGSQPISEVNRSRSDNELIVYNRFFGGSTATNASGTEVLIAPVDGWVVNDTISCVVEAQEKGQGNMMIPDGKAVLSGAGVDSTFLADALNVGDTIQFYIGLNPAIPQMLHSVGGFPTIVKEGQNYAVQGYYEEGGGSTFHTDLHPRTAVGFSQDSSKLFCITVDGRQAISRGMNLIEMADFMVGLGVWKGMNLDGGGSTTMIVRGAVENSPSDGTERYVRNALAVFSSAPAGDLHAIQIEPDYVRSFTGQETRFVSSGWDEYYSPVSLQAEQIEYSVDPQLGQIDANGRFSATGFADSGYIYVRYENSLMDSAFIVLKPIRDLRLSPQSCMMDTGRTVTLSVSALDSDSLQQTLEPYQMQWRSLDPTVCSVDSLGDLRSHSEGRTRVIASFYEARDTTEITVTGAQETLQLDRMENSSIWRLVSTNCHSFDTYLSVIDTPRTEGNGAFRVDYAFTRSQGQLSSVLLETDIYLDREPLAIELDCQSDGYKHKVTVLARDLSGNEFASTVRKWVTVSERFDTLQALMENFQPTSGSETISTPFRITGIEIQLGKSADIGEINQGCLYLDNLRTVFSEASGISAETAGQPLQYSLEQNFPNPFNPSTRISYRLPQAEHVYLDVFDLNGRRVARLVDQRQPAGQYNVIFRGTDVSSGVYIYRLKGEKIELSKKMLLLK